MGERYEHVDTGQTNTLMRTCRECGTLFEPSALHECAPHLRQALDAAEARALAAEAAYSALEDERDRAEERAYNAVSALAQAREEARREAIEECRSLFEPGTRDHRMLGRLLRSVERALATAEEKG